MRRTEPLFRLDSGWLFTLAGLAIIVASALLPADRDLHEMRQQLAAIEARQAWNDRRVQAYDTFLKELASKDPALMRRLAASQLNLMPEGERPLLMATSIEHTVSDWIEAAVPPSEYEPVPAPDTLLSRLAGGPRRLWLMGGGAMMVFVGLLSGIGVSQRPTLPEVPAATETVAVAEDAPVAVTSEAEEQAAVAETSARPEAVAEAEPEPVAATASETDLPDESAELDPAQSTADAVEVESYEWSEPLPPFDAAEADSGATPDAVSGGSSAEPKASAAEEHGWMRDHGSD